MAGVDFHLGGIVTSGLYQPGVYDLGDDQGGDADEDRDEKQHWAEIQEQEHGYHHDTAPEHRFEDTHIIVVVENPRIGGEQGQVGCVAAGTELLVGPTQGLVNHRGADVMDSPCGNFGINPAAEELKGMAANADENHNADVEEGFLPGRGIDQPFELKGLERRQYGHDGCQQQPQCDLGLVFSVIGVYSSLHSIHTLFKACVIIETRWECLV